MRINVCVNGSFRYPQYIRWYAAAGALGDFHYAHRRSTTARSLGLPEAAAQNGFAKEYALQAAWRALPGAAAARAELALCDHWQRRVIRHWRDCDSVEAVIGAVADQVLGFARSRGSRTLGHPVCAHPDTVARAVGRAYAELGLDPRQAEPVARAQRLAEIAACDHLLVDSTAVARSFEQAGVAADRISIVTPAVDLARFHPRRPTERDRDVFRVVCVATLTPRKAQQVLLAAWRLLGLRNAELLLIGPPGRDAGAVVSGFEGTFSYRRRVPNAELRALLVRASVFVLPSVEDGFGQAPLEAMASGIPVIVTRNVGMADLVTEGQDGFIVQPFDAEAIAARVELLYRDPARAEGMGVAAARTAERHGSWAGYVDRVLDIHRSILNRPAPLARSAAA